MEGKNRGWEIGLYDQTSPRYFCVTGQIVDGRSSIRRWDPTRFFFQSSQSAMGSRLGEGQDLRNRIPRPKLGKAMTKKEARLKRGEWQVSTRRRAKRMLRWCGIWQRSSGTDAVAIDREFRKSGLMRPKWDKRNGNGTYGARTIANCLKKKSEPTGRVSPRFSEDALVCASPDATQQTSGTSQHGADGCTTSPALDRRFYFERVRQMPCICREASEECLAEKKDVWPSS